MFEVLTDGRRVWVNSDRGMSVGRFNPFGGGSIDIHHDTDVQIATGRQCLDCRRGTYDDFVRAMRDAYGIDL